MDPPLLWTAIITPFLESEEVDYDSLKSLLKMQEAFGNGILTLGSTGEALNLDYEELVNILDFTLSQNLTVPIMCGVGGINLKETKKWIELLETKNIDAYLLVSPLYAKPGDEGQYEWFKELMNISSKPVMMYNVPSRTGSSLSLSAVKRLNKHPQFWAIKEASGSPETFAKYVEAAGPGKVYSGDDAMCPSYAAIGCKGLVSVCANIWPKETQRYISDCLEGKLGDQETMWAESANSLFMASNPIPAKALMSELGMISTPILRAPLTHKEKIDGAKLMKSHLNITEWFLSK
ncbi:MAG: 4-hydroxy-tetrahydrodipicolinate synthase [Bacteriovoracaceae bacterium]|nr:4-hydroxy-tetrahydrodipicolinate synthase [Bacteriovoracaceae bacterium]